MATFSQMRAQGMQNVQNLLAGGTRPAPAPAPAPQQPSGTITVQQRQPDASGWLGVPYLTPAQMAAYNQSQQPTPDPYAAERAAAAAKAAEDARKAADLRNTITGTIGNLQNVYNQLYGDIAGAAQSQRGQLEQRFGRETGALGEQFTSEFPKIERAYAARGAYSSSYRQDAQEAAQKAFQRQLEDLKMQREQDAAKIGQFLASEQAKIQSEQGMLGNVLGRLGQTTDVNELMQLRNTIERQIADVQAQRGGAQSQEAYLRRFQEIAPASDRLANLQATLTNIIQGAAPTATKQAIANQIIGSAGLSPQEEEQLRNQITQQLG